MARVRYIDIFDVSSPVVSKNPISKHNFIPNSKWIKFLISVHVYSLVHVVWDFRPWDVVAKVCYFFRLHFQFLGPWDAHSVKIQVNKVLWHSPDHVQPLQRPQIINSNHQKIMYFFRHYVPLTKISDDMNKFLDCLKSNRQLCNNFANNSCQPYSQLFCVFIYITQLELS